MCRDRHLVENVINIRGIFVKRISVQLEVKEAKKVESHPQWDISDDEAEKDKDLSDSDDYTSEEESD